MTTSQERTTLSPFGVIKKIPLTLSRLIAELGPLDALFYLVQRVLVHCGKWAGVYRYYLYAQPIAAGPRLAERRRGGEVRIVEPGDPVLCAFPLDETVLAHRFGQDALCLAAVGANGKATGCLWLTLGPFLEDEVRCCFVPGPSGGACWDFGVYVAPEYRAGTTFARLWDAADELLRGRGVRWSISRISGANPVSRRAHERLGARCLGSASFLVLGGWQVMVSSFRPWVHVSLHKAQIPRLVVDAEPPRATLPLRADQ